MRAPSNILAKLSGYQAHSKQPLSEIAGENPLRTGKPMVGVSFEGPRPPHPIYGPTYWNTSGFMKNMGTKVWQRANIVWIYDPAAVDKLSRNSFDKRKEEFSSYKLN